MVEGHSRGWWWEDAATIGGLVGVQLILSFYVIFLTSILALGLDPLFLVACGAAVSAVFLLPFAVAFERKKWPRGASIALLLKFVAIAFGGVTVCQALMLIGIKKTSPAIASAMPNLGPGFIFIIASCLRFEKFHIKCKYTRAKIIGTLVCLCGAIAISFSQSSSVSPAEESKEVTLSSETLGYGADNEWITGCLYLLAAVIVISFTIVLQAATMREFPAPFTLCVITLFLGSLLTAAVQFIYEGTINMGTDLVDVKSFTGLLVLGAVVSSASLSFQTWCIGKKGPVFVSMFSPVQTVCCAVLSAIILGQFISLETLMGMVLMFAGLYIVLWAKRKEVCNITADTTDVEAGQVNDIEKPLLS